MLAIECYLGEYACIYLFSFVLLALSPLLDATDCVLYPQCSIMWQGHIAAPIILKQFFKAHGLLL